MNHLSQISLGLLSWTLSIPSALAARFGGTPTISGLPGTASTAGIKTIIVDVVNDVLTLLGILAVVVIIIAGVRMVLSLGNETAVEGSKKTILYAVIGLIIVILARVIVGFVLNINFGP
jgi:hypothetical protein